MNQISSEARTLIDFFGEPISTYTRTQALADGVLVEVDPQLAREAGFVVPVALTAEVYEDCVAWNEDDDVRKGTCQDQTGRLWDVLYLARHAARHAANQTGQVARFQLYRIPRQGRDRQPRRVDLLIHLGPGDHGEPVITISHPGEL